MDCLNVIAIIVAGLMVGDELAIAVFVHPALDRLPGDIHLPAASALARVLGRFMPFWYILVFLLIFSRGVDPTHQSGLVPIWIVTSAILWVLADCVFDHHSSADQQPHCILDKSHGTS